MTDEKRPSDIVLPKGWTWDDVETQRARWGMSPNMVPTATAPGAVAWCTIRAVRLDRARAALETREAHNG